MFFGSRLNRLATSIRRGISKYSVGSDNPGLVFDFIDNFYQKDKNQTVNFDGAITHARTTNATMTDGYGPELVTNGSFTDSIDGWSGAGWVWSSRGASYDSGSSVTVALSQDVAVEAGKTYIVTFTLIDVSGGTPSLMDGEQSLQSHSTSGNYEYVYIADSSTFELGFRGGTATFYVDNVSVREMPVIKWAPHNLLTYSEDPSSSLTSTNDASWTSNNTLTATAQSGNQTPYARVLTTFTQKGTYVFAVETTSTTVQYLTLQTQIFDANANGVSVFDIQSGSVNTEASQHTATITATSSGFLCAIEFELDGTDLNGYLTMGLSEVSGIHRIIDPDGTESVTVTRLRSYRSDLGGMVNNPDRGDSYVPTTSSAKYLPRIGHHVYNGSAWANEGLLAESESRANLLTYSNDFTNSAWTAGSNVGTLSLDSVGPDGQSNSAVKLIDDGSTGSGGVSLAEAVTVDTSSDYTLSLYAKKDQLDEVLLYTSGFTTPSTNGYVFNLTDGTFSAFGGTPDHTPTIQDVGNGWYRCAITFTTDSADTNGAVAIYVTDNGSSGVSLDGTSSILIYGAQFEKGSTPSSLIPTSGSSVTRAAETFTIPSANLPWPTPQYIGSELVDSGTFDDASALDDWIASNANLSINNQRLEVENSGSSQGTARQSITTEIGKVYEASFDVVKVSGEGNPIVRLGVSNGGAEYYSVAHSSDATVSFIFTPTTTTTFWTLYTGSSTSGFSAIFDNISVREINPLSVSIATEGRVTYADTDSTDETMQYRWFADSQNRIQTYLDTASTRTGQMRFFQQENGVVDVVSTAATYYSPDVLVPFNVASRHGSTFVNGATEGVALTADTTPTALADLSSADLELAYNFQGTIGTFRVWDKDLGDTGIVEATNPSLEPSLSLTFEGTGTNSFIVNDWSE
jgi:hypothetical protein